MLKVNYYSRRKNGISEVVNIANVDQDDIQFFVDNDYIVSIEDMPSMTEVVMYARPRDMDEEDEVLLFSNMEVETCNDAFKRLVRLCKEEFHAN